MSNDQQKPMSVEEAKSRLRFMCRGTVLGPYDKEEEDLIAAVRADTESKVRAEIAGKMEALAEKFLELEACDNCGHQYICIDHLKQLASEIKGKQ